MEAGHNANAQLKSIVERIENVENQLADLRVDKAEIYKEAASSGYDVLALRAIVRARRETAEQKAKREAREANEELYRGALTV